MELTSDGNMDPNVTNTSVANNVTNTSNVSNVTSTSVDHNVMNTSIFQNVTNTSIAHNVTNTSILHDVTNTSAAHNVTNTRVAHNVTNTSIFHDVTNTSFVFNVTNTSIAHNLSVQEPSEMSTVFGNLYIGFTVCSVLTCLTIMIKLVKNRNGKFFNWLPINRFTFYVVLSDFLYYLAQSANLVYVMKFENDGFGFACSTLGILIYVFAGSQIVMAIIMALYVLVIIIRNHPMPLGRFDWRLLTSSFGLPLAALITAFATNNFHRNAVHCGFEEKRGFWTWHFMVTFVSISLSFVLIFAVYMVLWLYTLHQARQNSATLKQRSAVNMNRLAFTLSMFVLVYVLQFGGHAIEAMWVAFDDQPVFLRYCVALASTIGGILNGVVYFTIRT